MASTETTPTRRKYKRRTDEERIAELQAKIDEIKAREASKKKKDDPLLREIPKVGRRLRKFAQLAADHRRLDIVNMTTAFVASLERIHQAESKESRPLTEAELEALPRLDDED